MSSNEDSDELGENAEDTITRFQLCRILNQDCNGRRVSLMGTLDGSPAILLLERAALPSSKYALTKLHQNIRQIKIIGDNDVYKWYMAASSALCPSISGSSEDEDSADLSDLKISLICPCNAKHVKKYSAQEVRMVKETPEIYALKVLPYMRRMREEGRLNWVYNIIEGRAEQETIIARYGRGDEAFILSPDLNWDQKTLTSLHLLAIVERRDLLSLRDLKVEHVPFLKNMRGAILQAATKRFPELQRNQFKMYLHYQPTFYHLHIHVVHCMSEATGTQAVGKAFSLDNLISQLETMKPGPDAGMHQTTLTYSLGTQSDLWTEVFSQLNDGCM